VGNLKKYGGKDFFPKWGEVYKFSENMGEVTNLKQMTLKGQQKFWPIKTEICLNRSTGKIFPRLLKEVIK